MPRLLSTLLVAFMIALVIGAPAWYAARRERHFRNLRVVEPGVLYRSGQLDAAGLKRVVTEHGIKTIVTLREGDAPEDQAEEQWARQAALNFVRIPPRPWYKSDGTVPAEIGLAAFRKVMADPANHPVLIHCFAGIHRTGSYVAIHRIDHGWTCEGAINEMRLFGYTTLDSDLDVHHYLRSYRPQRAELPVIRPVSRER